MGAKGKKKKMRAMVQRVLWASVEVEGEWCRRSSRASSSSSASTRPTPTPMPTKCVGRFCMRLFPNEKTGKHGIRVYFWESSVLAIKFLGEHSAYGLLITSCTSF